MLEKDPFGEALIKAFKDSRAQGRALEVRRVREQDEAQGVPDSLCRRPRRRPRGRPASGLEPALGNRPILTVTDGDAEGMTVAFVMEGNRLRYEVDLGAAERAGLKIAAPMLISARKVRPSGNPPEEAP